MLGGQTEIRDSTPKTVPPAIPSDALSKPQIINVSTNLSATKRDPSASPGGNIMNEVMDQSVTEFCWYKNFAFWSSRWSKRKKFY